jgi:amino acid transporter
MCLLIFGGPASIGALFSIGAIAQFIAFAIPITIRVCIVGNRFRPGPWHLGRFSKPIGAAGALFVLLMLPILCLPSVNGSDLTLALMNWTCLVYGGPMVAVTVWWFVDARKWFKGPKVNIEHSLYQTEGTVYEGVAGPDEKVREAEDSSSKEGADAAVDAKLAMN